MPKRKTIINEDDKYIISHFVNEWKMTNQYINDIDRGYMKFITVFTAIAAFTATLISVMADYKSKEFYVIFYIIPLAFVVTFGCMGYQFRTTAILRGHLAYIEDKINDMLGETFICGILL